MPRKRKAARPFRHPDGLTAGEQADLIIEMTLAGGGCHWNPGELAAYEQDCRGKGPGGAALWEKFRQEYRESLAGMTAAEGVGILEHPEAPITEGQMLAFHDWIVKQPDGKRLYHDWRRGGRKNDLTQSQRA